MQAVSSFMPIPSHARNRRCRDYPHGPKLKVGFGGLPVDSFKFDEDAMTNISVGLMQQFERGDTLDLQGKKPHSKPMVWLCKSKIGSAKLPTVSLNSGWSWVISNRPNVCYVKISA